MSTGVCIAGVGSTRFGVIPGRSLQSLAVEAARAAIADSKIAPAHIGCVFVGNFVGGIMTGQE
jgi:acetyl-CoA C-acetyltransferase